MGIATSFMPLLQVFTAAMTEPTAESFRQLVAGWIFAPRRNIIGALRATDPTKHHSAYHRIFASARWFIDQVGLAMFDLVATAKSAGKKCHPYSVASTVIFLFHLEDPCPVQASFHAVSSSLRPRCDLVEPAEVQVLHCVQRCVRRAFLCGEDRFTGQSFEYRREWIRARLEFLASVFGLDCLTYMVLSNHLHVFCRSRPDVVATWSDEQVASLAKAVPKTA